MTSVGGKTSIVGVFKWDTQLCERVERERAEARSAAGVGPEEWVNDWEALSSSSCQPCFSFNPLFLTSSCGIVPRKFIIYERHYLKLDW